MTGVSALRNTVNGMEERRKSGRERERASALAFAAEGALGSGLHLPHLASFHTRGVRLFIRDNEVDHGANELRFCRRKTSLLYSLQSVASISKADASQLMEHHQDESNSVVHRLLLKRLDTSGELLSRWLHDRLTALGQRCTACLEI